MPDDRIYESLTAGAEGVQVDDSLIPDDITRDSEVNGRLLPVTTGLGVADNGDIVALSGGQWIRAGFENGIQTQFAWNEATGNIRFDWRETHKQKEVEDSFIGAGWTNSNTAQVSDSIKTGSTAHTASEITGLTYVEFRTQPSPNSEPAFIAVRILLQDKVKVGRGQIRITEGERDNLEPYDPAIILTDANHVTDSGDYAYYSIRDNDGFVSDDATWVQDREPWHLNPNDVETGIVNVFDAQDWQNSTASLLSASSSTTPYTQHNNNIRTVSSWGVSHAVGATSSGFYLAVRIPIADKSALEHYRLTSSRDSSVKAITDGEHVVDTSAYAFYNIFFPAGAATTVTIQEREDHVFNPRKGTINWTQLHDTPDSIDAGKIVIGNPAGTQLEFGELQGGDAAVTINGLTIGFDQSQLDILQLGAAQATGVNQVFLTNASGTPTRVVLPGAAYNIDPNNHVVVEWAYGDVREGRLVYSAILRRLATIAAKTGSEASGDDYHPIDIGYDSSGNRMQLRLYRAADNTLILGGALITTSGTLTTQAGVTPPRAFQASIYLYEVGGNAGAAGRQQVAVNHAPRYVRRWRRTAANVTPNMPVGFDGVVWTGIDDWNAFPVTGTTPAGQILWYGEGEATYSPMATFDWQASGTVYPADNVRFASVANPRTDAQITDEPVASSAFWNTYDAATGWSRYWYPLLSDPDWSYLDRVDWRPNAVGSTANIDFPELDTAQYSGIGFWVNIYNSGGHDVWYRVPFLLEPLPNVQSVATGSITITHLDGGEMSWEHRNEAADIHFSDFNLPGGANQANYQKFGCNFQLQHRSTPGGTRINRVSFRAPQVYHGTLRWEIEMWARKR